MVEVCVRLKVLLCAGATERRLPCVGLRRHRYLNRRLYEHVRGTLVLMQIEPMLMLLNVAQDMRLLLLRQLASLSFRWNRSEWWRLLTESLRQHTCYQPEAEQQNRKLHAFNLIVVVLPRFTCAHYDG